MRAVSCGRHYPEACPASCIYRGNRFSRQQITQQRSEYEKECEASPRIVAECFVCEPDGLLMDEPSRIAQCRAAGHDVRERKETR